MREFMRWFVNDIKRNWFSRLLLIVQIYFAWDLLSWSESFGSTALYQASQGKVDLLGAAAVVGAVAAAPLALITFGINKYMDMNVKIYSTPGERRTETREGAPQ